MAPTYRPGQEVLVHPGAYRRRTPAVGDVVLARHPREPGLRIVKRVTRVEPDGRLFLVGDNPLESTDSRAFGALGPDAVLGRVVYLLPI